jgi:hypothetical protein
MDEISARRIKLLVGSKFIIFSKLADDTASIIEIGAPLKLHTESIVDSEDFGPLTAAS